MAAMAAEHAVTKIGIRLRYWLGISLIAGLMACRRIAVCTDATRPYTVRVSPSGRPFRPTSSVPSLANPALSSLQDARDALRSLRAKGLLRGPARVEVEEATYFLSEPLRLSQEDSNVTFVGVGRKRPRISGGEVITGWRPASPGLWVAAVADAQGAAGALRSLYVNDTRATLARSPNDGYFHVVGGAPALPGAGFEHSRKSSFRFKRGDLRSWPDLTNGNLVVLFAWETALLPIKELDEAQGVVTLTGEARWPILPNQRYYVENVREALDAPGEWYLDREKRLLYYRPRAGEDMESAQVVAPRLQQLVVLDGDPDSGRLVSNVRFENLSFEHTNYLLEPSGHADGQAAATVNATIQAVGATRCAFINCEVAHFGNYGIWLERGCTDNEIAGSYIHDGSAGGVRVGQTAIPGGSSATSGNRVTDCLIRDLGNDFAGAVAVWIGQSDHNVVTHNEICDARYTGISCGWTWGYGPSAASHNIIDHNYVHDLGHGGLCDMAAIYTLGIQPGTIVRNNLIHDIWDGAECLGASGIYPDEGSSKIVIEGNVVYQTASGGLTIHYGRDIVCRNNVFAFGRDNQVVLGRRDGKSSLTFEHNIVYFDNGESTSLGTASFTPTTISTLTQGGKTCGSRATWTGRRGNREDWTCTLGT